MLTLDPAKVAELETFVAETTLGMSSLEQFLTNALARDILSILKEARSVISHRLGKNVDNLLSAALAQALKTVTLFPSQTNQE